MRPEYLSSYIDRHVLLPQMDAISAKGKSDIDSIIYDQGYMCSFQVIFYFYSLSVKLLRAGLFFPKLHECYSPANRGLDNLEVATAK